MPSFSTLLELPYLDFKFQMTNGWQQIGTDGLTLCCHLVVTYTFYHLDIIAQWSPTFPAQWTGGGSNEVRGKGVGFTHELLSQMQLCAHICVHVRPPLPRPGSEHAAA